MIICLVIVYIEDDHPTTILIAVMMKALIVTMSNQAAQVQKYYFDGIDNEVMMAVVTLVIEYLHRIVLGVGSLYRGLVVRCLQCVHGDNRNADLYDRDDDVSCVCVLE